VTSLDEIGCGSMAVSYYDVSKEEIVQDVLRDNPKMLNDIYRMALMFLNKSGKPGKPL
jgi:hypothetical protein